MLLDGKKKGTLNALEKQLNSAFSMKDFGEAEHILGMQIKRDRQQYTYPKKSTWKKCWIDLMWLMLSLVECHCSHMLSFPRMICFKDDDAGNCMKNVPYASACDSLMYAMVATWPDIVHAVGVVSRFIANPGRAHREAIKSILRYLKGTKGKCLCYGKGPSELKGFCDSYMVSLQVPIQLSSLAPIYLPCQNRQWFGFGLTG